MKKRKTANKGELTQADLAQKWNLTPGRIWQFVRDGMPLTSLADAVHWRRKEWDIMKSGPLPDYLLSRAERVTLEQDTYDHLVYKHGVDPKIASEIAFMIYCRKGKGYQQDTLHAGKDRTFYYNGELEDCGTWFARQMEDPNDWEYTPKQYKEMLKAADEADHEALKDDDEFNRKP